MTNDRWVVFDLIGVLAEPSWRDIVVSRPDLKEKWEKLKRGTEEEDSFWDAALQSTYRNLLAFRADRLELVRHLRQQGVHVAIASNFYRSWLDSLLKKIPESEKIFERTLVSSDPGLGAAKPEPAFWARLKQLVPEGSIFVDDRRDNCDAAEKAGFQAIWAHPAAQIERALDERLRAA